MKDYIERAMRTNTPDDGPISRILQDQEALNLLHACMGVATEAGELIDPVKKYVWYGKDLDKTNLVEEVGDILWYLAIILKHCGSTFEDAQRINIKKLLKRYPDKFTEDKAIYRDLEGERVILEEK